jgi:signal transduction histidine kinase
MYKEFMEDITDEIDRETNVINDLLSLVRMDRSGATLNITSVQMNDMIEDLLRRLKPLAEKQEVELVLESFRPVVCEVDEVKFSLALMNLVENGIKYNHEGGFVHVTLNADKQYCFIRVEDSGIGIPEDSVGHIFERFYRVDKSHSREIGGTGLGLAIVSDVIALHRGEIKVSSVLGEGSFFDIRIPLKYMIGGTGDEA